MARVLLAHSYFLRFDPKALRQMQPYPPLGTLYAASVLRRAGHDVHLFDPMLAEREDEIAGPIKGCAPDVVVFFEDNFNYLSKMCLTRMREACLKMTAYAKRAGCIVIAQGSDPVDHLVEYFAGGIDVVICGEGEETVVETLSAIEAVGAGSWADLRDDERSAILSLIRGIAWLSGDRIRINERRPLIRNLDALPWPARDLVDMARYRDAWLQRHGFFSLNVVTTRGCPFHCNWCAKPVYGQVYHSRSPESVIDEIVHLKTAYAPDHLWFADDILGLTPGWLARYADLADERGCIIPFSCQTRADILLKERNAIDVARAGARMVWIGAESGSQRILDAMEKGTTIDQIRDATSRLQAAGAGVAWFLQLGYPGETRADLHRTMHLLRRGKPDDIGVSVTYPLPGTGLYRRVESLLGAKRNWTDSGDLDLMFPGRYHPSFYRALHAAIHREFRLRKGVRDLFRWKWSRGARLVPLNALLLLVARLRMLSTSLRPPRNAGIAAGAQEVA